MGRDEVRRAQRVDGGELGHHRETHARAARRRRAARDRALGARGRIERADRAARRRRVQRRHRRPSCAKIRAQHDTLANELGVDASIFDERFRTLAQVIAGVKLVGEVSPRVHARVLANGELAATELGVAYLRSTGPRRRVARHPRVPRELRAARPDRDALAICRPAAISRPTRRFSSASPAIDGNRAVAGLPGTQRARRDGATRSRRLRHDRRLSRRQARGAQARDLDRCTRLLQRRSEGRAVGAAHQEPALPRGTGDRVRGRRHSASAQHFARACVRHSVVPEVHDASGVGRQRHLERAR